MYLTKFLIQWMMPPGCIIVILTLLGVHLIRRKAPGRFLVPLMAACLLTLSLPSFSAWLAAPLEDSFSPPAIADIKDRDCLIMTGAGSVGNVPDIDGRGQTSGIMARSMLTAFRLQQETGLPLVVTGGCVWEDQGRESEIASRILREMGVPEENLFAEDESRNTAENAAHTRALLERHGWNRPVLLAPALHSRRAALFFARQGMDCLVWPTGYTVSFDRKFEPCRDLAPSAHALGASVSALHEYLGIFAYRMKMQ